MNTYSDNLKAGVCFFHLEMVKEFLQSSSVLWTTNLVLSLPENKSQTARGDGWKAAMCSWPDRMLYPGHWAAWRRQLFLFLLIAM